MKTKQSLRKVIWASLLGNALELYDYTLYGYFAAILATLFFPSQDPTTGLLLTYGVYASGFIFRPLGAILFGAIGDRYGRKRALELSILMMAIPTLLIGFLPTYAAIGIWAPLLLTILRLFQGLSVGGELVGSFTYLVEHAPEGRRGFIGSWTVLGGFGGKLVGTFVAGIVSLCVAPSILESWGWRIPFLLGLGFAFAGYRIRKHIEESPVFLQMQSQNRIHHAPLRQALVSAPKELVQAMGIIAIHSSMIHLLFIYFPVFLKTQLRFSYTQSLFSTFFALATAMLAMPLGGHMSDKIGRQKVMLTGAVILTTICWPAFNLLAHATVPVAIATHLCLAALIGITHGPFPAMLNELFAPEIRYSATAISYNTAVCIFGGLAPVIVTKLIAMTGSPAAPAIWLVLCGVISVATLVSTGETRHRFELPAAA